MYTKSTQNGTPYFKTLKTEIHREQEVNNLSYDYRQGFSAQASNSTGNNAENKKIGLYEIRKCRHSKGNNHPCEKRV